jgi:hypothetical protein
MKRNQKWLLHIFAVMVFVVFIVLAGCGTIERAAQGDSGSAARTQTQQQAETEGEKYNRLASEDNERLLGSITAELTIGNMALFQPQLITGIGEITNARLSEPGRPYYFTLKAIYKGHDTRAERILLQDLGTQSNVGDAAWGADFGIDTNVYPVKYTNQSVSTFPTDANSVATFHLRAVRFSDGSSGAWVRFVHDIEKPAHDPSKFIVASGMRYITVNDARVTTQEDVMAAYFLGSAATNVSNIFDPIIYPLVDLMDARVEMNRKDIRNDATFPRVRVKYVSEVIFRGQTNTTITVSTDDNVLTERMDFTGRASSVSNGERIRVYYTIAKDPLEKWEIQAIERL